MSLKDRYNEYKEEKERKDYFRKRNDLYVDKKTYLKTFFISFFVSIFFGLIIYYLTSLIGIRFSYLYIVLGGIVGNVVKYVSQVSSKQMGVLAVISTVLGLIFTNVIVIGYFYVYAMGISGIFYSFFVAFNMIVNDIFVLLSIALSSYIAFITAR